MGAEGLTYFGQFAQSLRQAAFDNALYGAGYHGGCALGADGHDHWVPVNDSRGDEIGVFQVVDPIEQGAGVFCYLVRGGVAAVVFGGGIYQASVARLLSTHRGP